jgi:hydrogenase maturation protease
VILVIGYGNPLRGDDGVGNLLAQHLVERNRDCEVEILPCHQLTPELAEPVSRACVVVFIDAQEGRETGDLSVRTVQPLSGPVEGAFTHNVTPETLLGAARTLYGASPEGVVITIEGHSFDYGETVSPAMQAALPGLLEAIEQLIQLECQLTTTEVE